MAQRPNYRTQWAAQFFAAAELARRGYLVALTQGNAKRADLLVESPSGVKFSVDVKGLATHNWWLMRERADTDHPDFYILVYVPDAGRAPEYFVLSGAQVAEEMKLVRQQAELRGPWNGAGSGIRWATSQKYAGSWDVLPQ